MKTVSMKLPDDLDARLRVFARQTGLSRSEIVRQAILAYLPGDKEHASAHSALDLVEDLVGCVEGPPDLSTNRKHMEGYGE